MTIRTFFITLTAAVFTSCTINIHNNKPDDDEPKKKELKTIKLPENIGVKKKEIRTNESLGTKPFKMPEKKPVQRSVTFIPNIKLSYTLPNDYRFMTQKELKAIYQKGADQLNAPVNSALQLWGIKRGDKDNIIINVDLAQLGRDDEISQAFQDIQDVYAQRNMSFTTKRSFLVIGKLIFTKLSVSIYTDFTKTKVLLYQDFYMAKTNGRIITINSNADDIISSVLQNSMLKNATFSTKPLIPVN
jgi:hypothetical protein